MQTWNRLPRILLVISLLIVLCAGMFAPRVEQVEAKPLEAVDQVSILISEFRVRGPNGADDEFVELYNATGTTIFLNNWRLRRSSGCGATLTDIVAMINVSLAPGQYYLLAKTPEYSGGTVYDQPYSSAAGVADDGGIALLDNAGNIVDQAGLCDTTTYKEGTALSSMSGTADQSYERRTNGSAGSCRDTDNNAADFIFNSATSNPQNLSNPFLPCLVVTGVDSSTGDGTYTAGAVIDIQITFSSNVNVTGNPQLLLETGTTDRNAVYVSGSGTAVLTFQYTVAAGDSSADLDYVSANALTLNGGTITGAIGDAVLILPKPGDATAISLADNRNIAIDSSGNPAVTSITRQNPVGEYTNANVLVFRVTFNEAVLNAGVDDFVATGTTAIPALVTPVSGSILDVTVSGGDLAGLNNTVGLDLAASPTITDVNMNPLIVAEPTTDETYTVDNIQPNVTINQSPSQADPALTQPILFTVVFSEPINTNTFTVSDIDQAGSTASGIAWTIIDSGDHTTFTLSATATDNNGLIVAALPAGRVNDMAGNLNTLYTSGDNNVTLNDNTPPTVTISQSPSQADPASTLPITFTVNFSEPINAGLFTTSDITQNGTAPGITWSIVDSGDHRNFTLSATATTGYGTIIPSIAANRVTDYSGNNNLASGGSTDNSVTYVLLPTSTPTRTPTPTNTRSVVINEIAWAGTSSTLIDDEWIELYNPGTVPIDITDWVLRATDGAPLITLDGVIPAGGYFLLERDDDITVSDIAADQIYTGALSNNGEILTLYDASNKAVDTANGNGGSWPRGSSTTFGTMERITNSADSDSAWVTNTGSPRNGKNANGGDILGTPKNKNTVGPTPTPGKTSTPTRTLLPPTIAIDPRPIINEVLPRPGYDWNGDGRVDVFDEFIEIKNLTAIDINLKGWRLDDEANLGSNPYTLPDIILRPGERVVLFGLETNILLSDGGDTVRLINPNGKIYDAYTYAIAKAEDRSICRLPDGNPGSNSWFDDCIPTPKLSNTREGSVPVSPGGNAESPVCDLPDTIPADFFFAECRGYGAGIWSPFFWDSTGWMDKLFLPSSTSKWKSFVE